MASLWKKADQISGAGNKSAAKIYEPRGTGDVDIVNDYMWTLTPAAGRKEIPTIELWEYQIDETMIKRQIAFYVNGVGSTVTGGNTTGADFLSPYDQLFPKDKETGFKYTFPYYADVNFEVNTPPWASLDTLEAAGKGAADLGSLIHPAIGKAMETGGKIAGGVIAGTLAANYPKIGIMDRPKLWESHDFRSYTIKLPLYNTYNPEPDKPEWVKNRELCELLVNQNLYNKLTFITGIPPVFYEVLIPGQHYSPATCVTNITIYNRGNIRQFISDGYTFNVPDVYELNISLTDLVIPSKNLFQAIGDSKVRSSLKERSQGTLTDVSVQAATDIFTNTYNNIANSVQQFLD